MTGPPSAWRGPCRRRPARKAGWPLGWLILALGVARLVAA